MRFFLLFLGLFILGFQIDNAKQQKYLPVHISILDTSNIPKTFVLNLKAAFGTRKIKTISQKDAEALIYNESYSVTESYYKSGGDLRDVDKWKNYFAANMSNVGNSLTISIKVDVDGILNDTVKWDSRTMPVNLVNFHKPKWHYMVLDSINAKTMLQMSQSIVDSIIASNVLVKD
ncbi:MAG: hypothetical protein ABIO79_04585 [Ferruginibacter sp.]